MLEIANERGNNPNNPNKRHPLDFVLWQAQAPGEPAWHSPWGLGRPGWHIECSTMVAHYLGNTIDLHSGGGNLLFPHHECEIAQIESITGKRPFVRHWLHTAMVELDRQKYSASPGKFDYDQRFTQGEQRQCHPLLPGKPSLSPRLGAWRRAAALRAATDAVGVLTKALQAQSGVRGDSVDADVMADSFVQVMDDDVDTVDHAGLDGAIRQTNSRSRQPRTLPVTADPK